MMQIVVWILGAIAAYRLWDHYMWLSIIVILAALSFELGPAEKREQSATGLNPDAAAHRFFWSTLIVIGIFIYSLFV
jgi:hypothetical protein